MNSTEPIEQTLHDIAKTIQDTPPVAAEQGDLVVFAHQPLSTIPDYQWVWGVDSKNGRTDFHQTEDGKEGLLLFSGNVKYAHIMLGFSSQFIGQPIELMRQAIEQIGDEL